MVQTQTPATLYAERISKAFDYTSQKTHCEVDIYLEHCYIRHDQHEPTLLELIDITEVSTKIKRNTRIILANLNIVNQSDIELDGNPNGTISIEFDKDSFDNNYYLHIEIGKTFCNWQYRYNGNRVASQDGIMISEDLNSKDLNFFKKCLADLPY